MADFKIWMNGKLVPQAEAVLPVNSAAVFYASNVFEGIRAYWNEAEGELYCFRLAEHFARLRESMKMMRFTVPYSDMDIYEAVREVLRGNEIREDVHMHLVAYVSAPGLDSTVIVTAGDGAKTASAHDTWGSSGKLALSGIQGAYGCRAGRSTWSARMPYS